MKVVLLAHTPTPEQTVAAAARLCYSDTDVEALRESISQERAEQFVEMLAGFGHESPVEHVTFTFGIEGVSRSFLAQVTRHRIASFSVQSQRYVAEDHFEFVLLPNACETKMILTMNVRSLRNFFRLRCCNRAQWEIREVATEMLRLCCEVSPALFRTAGPSCYCGGCTEGKMSCGKAKEVREKFEVIHGETR